MKKFIQKGFSMVELMVILAALGGVALVVTRLGKNSIDIQQETQIAMDYADLVRNFHFTFGDETNCKEILEDITLEQSQLASPVSLQQDKVLKKSPERFSLGKINLKIEPGVLTPGQKLFGSKAVVEIADIKSKKPLKDFEPIAHPLHLTLSLDESTGKISVKNCERFNPAEFETVRVWCGTVTTACLSGQKVMAVGKYNEGKFSGTVHALELGTILNCTGLINQAAELAICGE